MSCIVFAHNSKQHSQKFHHAKNLQIPKTFTSFNIREKNVIMSQFDKLQRRAYQEKQYDQY